MIDKSIRQYYQEGNKVNYIEEGIKKFVPTNEQGKIDVGQVAKQVAKNVVTNKLTNVAAKKFAGTGILTGLGPIGMLIAMVLARKGIGKGQEYLTKKFTEGGVQQVFQTGFGLPQESKELRKLENRRANMLQRKEEGKKYSDKNLGIVTRAIAEAKGIDINNPNEMKNIDKDISRLYSKTIFADPSVDSEENQPDNQIITTPKKVSPISYEDDFATTTIEDIINKKVSPISYEDDFATTTIKDIITPPVFNPGIAAQEKEAANRAAEEKASANRAMQATIAAAEKAAAQAKATVSVPVPAHISRGGQNGNQSQSSSSGGGYSRGDYGGRGHHWAKGGRVDKPLTGRSRDI